MAAVPVREDDALVREHIPHADATPRPRDLADEAFAEADRSSGRSAKVASSETAARLSVRVRSSAVQKETAEGAVSSVAARVTARRASSTLSAAATS